MESYETLYKFRRGIPMEILPLTGFIKRTVLLLLFMSWKYSKYTPYNTHYKIGYQEFSYYSNIFVWSDVMCVFIRKRGEPFHLESLYVILHTISKSCSNIRSVLDINLTCCYDKHTFIYTGGVGWERINIGLCAPSQHHRWI